MITESLRRLLEEQVPYARLLRRRLHGIAELGGYEYETAALVKAALPVPAEPIAGTGLVVRLGPEAVDGNGEGGVEGNAVGVRAELDGLPLVERTGAPFSATGDRMHACGHDVHLAALVALVRAAAEVQSELPAPLIAIFQPSEERSPSGALQVTADTGLVGESKAFVAVHVHPDLPWGSLGLEPGVVNAQADEVQIRIEGVGGHAAYPHRARSVVPALLALGQGMREIAGRLIDPMRPALVEIGVLRAGEAANVIPGIGELHATVRTLAHGDQSRLLAGIRQLADRISAAYDCAATVAVTKSEPALVNDAGLVDVARRLTSDLAFDIAPPWRSCGGDDFAHYGQYGPALMAFVGLDGAPGFTPAALHTAHFLPPEEAVDQSARALLLAYLAAASLPPRGRAVVTTPV